MRALTRIAAPRNGSLITSIALAVANPTFGICSHIAPVTLGGARWSSSSSRWKQRQGSDYHAKKAKLLNLKSRAAFKLLEIDSKYRLFKRGQTVIDLGYAPGSWSQVVVERTKPNGRVVGIDIIPAQPPKGVSTIQGNFLSPGVQQLVKDYLAEFAKPRNPDIPITEPSKEGEIMVTERQSYIDAERAESAESEHLENDGRLVDVVLSDMSDPWERLNGPYSKTLSNPYRRMMNTSGNNFRDHAGSMDLCLAALQFASDTLKSGGHFVCKFYQGAEDKDLELKLRKMFAAVHREKPESSRKESKESYFVALRRKGDATLSL
ncbi:23S ribosomal RNA methyltransferase [Annulohypoxylon nitens]|nr:23S ribosomal RNA methyltransferase [Annulohypoxylon nitens]